MLEPNEGKLCAAGRGAASLTESRGVRRETPGSSADLTAKAGGDKSLSEKRETREGVYRVVLRDPRAKVRAGLPDPQSPAVALHTRCDHACCGAIMSVPSRFHGAYSSHDGRCAASTCKGMNGAPPSHSYVQHHRNVGWPTEREPLGSRSANSTCGSHALPRG